MRRCVFREKPCAPWKRPFWLCGRYARGQSQRLPTALAPRVAEAKAYVRPFDGGPAKNPDNPVQALYDMVIDRATDHLYITTPYLVLDRQMAASLIRTAKSGVDVRIFMPGIYDKSYVHAVSRHNFGPLLRHGIRVFEYQPGFLHAKLLAADRGAGHLRLGESRFPQPVGAL